MNRYIMPMCVFFAGIATLSSASQPVFVDALSTYENHSIYITRDCVVTMETVIVGLKATELKGSDRMALVHLRFHPPILERGDAKTVAFRVLKPQLSVSAGRVRRFSFSGTLGIDAKEEADMGIDGDYVVDVEFDARIPRQLVVTLLLVSQDEFKGGDVLRYWRSSAGMVAYPEMDPARINIYISRASLVTGAKVNGVIIHAGTEIGLDFGKGKDCVVELIGNARERSNGVRPVITGSN